MLVEGRYNGILEAEKHYIPLKRDFSNIEDVLEKVRDHHVTQAVADRAYEDIYLSGRYTYRTLAADIERALHGNDDGREDSLQVLGLLLWPLARIRTRLATEGANAHVRYERLKQSIMSS